MQFLCPRSTCYIGYKDGPVALRTGRMTWACPQGDLIVCVSKVGANGKILRDVSIEELGGCLDKDDKSCCRLLKCTRPANGLPKGSGRKQMELAGLRSP